MMNKTIVKIICSFYLFILSGSLAAQQINNEFYISTSPGISTFNYGGLTTGEQKYSFGGGLGFGYKFFFTEHFGIDVGLEYAVYNGGFHAKNLEYLEVYPDPALGRIDYKAVFSRYDEKHRAFSLNVPILFQYQSSGHHKFYAALGGKINIPTNYTIKQDGINEITADAYIVDTNNYVTDLPLLGAGKFEKNDFERHKLKTRGFDTKLNVLASLEAGVKWELRQGLYLYTGAYIDYGLSSMSKANEDKQLSDFLPYSGMTALDDNGENASPLVNSFLHSRYSYDAEGNDVYFTKKDKINPLVYGLKLSLSFGKLNKDKTVFDEEINSLNDEQISDVIIGVIPSDNGVLEVETVVSTNVEVEPNVVVEPIESQMNITGVSNKPIVNITDERLQDLVREEQSLRPDLAIALTVDNYSINSANLSNEWKNIINDLIVPLKDFNKFEFVLEGHTCNLGSDEINDRLSLKRAQIVKDYLVSKGFATEAFKIVGKGKRIPLVPNTSLENRLKNRRVVFIIVDTSK